ncbi:MAG TPA: hypothetical protein VFR23_19825 [Jiangellaceae bacterium]|nr:hypothetical protein [Jiangellaceae bacterium]
MRRTTAVLASAVLLVIAGCSAEPGEQDGENMAGEVTGPSTPQAAPDSAESEVIPLGTFVKTETREDLTAAGADESVLDQGFAGVNEIRITWKIDDGRWTQFQSLDGQADEPGDLGTYTYDEDGRWVLTSDGCPGCVNAIEWSFDGGVLTLSKFGVEPVDEFDAFVLTVLFPGEYEKVD